jgi:wyosine [tRNA(Phe)-imidazoG37] synthetase (radical SAM superfamily)
MTHDPVARPPLLPLWSDIVYGPVSSRRLGRSLGLNVMPPGGKTCTFNCIYCQYGWTTARSAPVDAWPAPAQVATALSAALRTLAGASPDRITLAGHGEPTLHPAFGDVVDAIHAVRNREAPAAALAVLSNGTRVHEAGVHAALLRLDECYVKLDAGNADTLRRVNASDFPLDRLVAGLESLPGVTVQSLFVDDPRGRCGNADPASREAWLQLVARIRPRQVHLYTVARAPALARLRPVPRAVLDDLASRLRATGIRADVFC